MEYSKTEPAANGPDTLDSAESDHTAVRYNFKAAQRLTELQIKRLEDLNRHFSQDLADTLSVLTRKRVTANSASFEQVELLEVREKMPEMPLRFLLELKPLGIRAFLGLDSELTFSLLQAFLGGKTATATAPTRDLTDVELSVLDGMDRVVVQEVEKSWKEATGLELIISSQRTASRPEDMALFRRQFLYAFLDYSLEDRPAKVVLAYPTQISEVVGDGPSDGDQPPLGEVSEVIQTKLFERMRASQLVVEGCLQDSSVRLSDLLDLQVGDLLRLDLPLARPIDVRLNGERRFEAEFLETPVKKSLRIQNQISKY